MAGGVELYKFCAAVVGELQGVWGVAVGDDDRWSGRVRCRVHWLFSVFVGVYGDEEENQAMWLSVMMPVSSVWSSSGSET